MSISDLYSIFCEHPIITTDSRECPAGSIFFALKGNNFNGNEYASVALEKGCSYAVTDEQIDGVCDERIILVDDVLTTMQMLANYHRHQLGIRIIGVTGTNGKTTTKELISSVLSKKFNVLYTQGNFNNHIGVPKTLLRMTQEHDIAVVEMGANHPGEIKTLVEIVEPDFGIITNVGKAHIEGFGSFEGVIKTKGELYDFLRKGSKNVFINENNEYLMGISQGLNLIRYGNNGRMIACDPYLRMEYQGKTISTKLIGAYNIDNALAAATIGHFFGVEDNSICEALEEYTPSNNRSQLKTTDFNTLIIDAYNANPTSMMAALKNFRDMKVENKMAILGDMRELGHISAEEHQKVVDFIKDTQIECWLVGGEFAKTNCDFRKFNNVDEVKDEIKQSRLQGHYILIKGSNSTKLYQLPEYL